MMGSGGIDAGWRSGGRTGLLLVSGCALLVAVYLGLSIGHSEWKTAYLVMLALGAFPVMLALGSNYWAILPFAMTVSLPAIPLVPGRAVSLGELAAAAALGAFAARLPLGGMRIRWWRAEYLPVLFYFLWVAIIYKVNGAGLAIFGSSTVGARSYLSIALAFGVFFVICNQTIGDRHCRGIIYSLLAASALSTLWNIYRHFNLHTGEEMYVGGFYSWHQNLSLFPMFFLAFVFARFPLTGLLREMRIGWLTAILICYALAAYSGKRAVFAGCLLLPLLSLALRRQYLQLFLAVLAAAGLLASLVAGHGRVFELPLTVQRVLWVLPGKWDAEVKMSTIDSFRRTLNKLALREIRDRPVVGRGFGFKATEAKFATNIEALQDVIERGDHLGAYIMAVGGQWHSTWLGISAALGIPGAVLWGFIWIQLLAVAWHVLRRSPPDSWCHTLAVMFLMLTVIDVCRSMTSGHAAQNFWAASWRLAVLLVLGWQIREARSEPGSTSRREAPAFAGAHRFRPSPAGGRGQALAGK